MKKIKESAIWKSVQGTGRKLDKHVYKELIKNFEKNRGWGHKRVISPSGNVNINMKSIKEAYHSLDTKPEYRAILLHSLFEPTSWLTNQYNYFRKGGARAKKVSLSLDRNKKTGRLYFRLVDERDKAVRLNSLMVSGIQQREIKSPQSARYVKALTTSGVKQQKAALWGQELNTCLVSLADVLITTVFLTDPINQYGSPPSYGDEDIPKESPETGNIKDKQDFRLKRYEQQLTTLIDQFKNYTPIANQLNFDTTGILNNLESLHAQINHYNVNERWHREDLLVEHHDLAVQTVEAIHDLAYQVENMDLDDPRLTKVAGNKVVPQFRDIEWRQEFHRTQTENASSTIANYSKRMLKYHNWEFDKD